MAKVPYWLAKQIVGDYEAFRRNPATASCPNMEQVATCQKIIAGEPVDGLPFSDTGEHVARYSPPSGEAPPIREPEVFEMRILSQAELDGAASPAPAGSEPATAPATAPEQAPTEQTEQLGPSTPSDPPAPAEPPAEPASQPSPSPEEPAADPQSGAQTGENQ